MNFLKTCLKLWLKFQPDQTYFSKFVRNSEASLMWSSIDGAIGKEQCGFWEGRGCINYLI